MNIKELLWKHAEGACTDAEKETLQQLLAGDVSLQREWEMIREIHTVLQGTVPEQPSMRFAQNVIEALPAIHPLGMTEALVPLWWKKIFWTVVAAVILAVIFFPGGSYSKGIGKTVDDFLNSLPVSSLNYFALLFVSATLLFLADRWLRIAVLRQGRAEA